MPIIMPVCNAQRGHSALFLWLQSSHIAKPPESDFTQTHFSMTSYLILSCRNLFFYINFHIESVLKQANNIATYHTAGDIPDSIRDTVTNAVSVASSDTPP